MACAALQLDPSGSGFVSGTLGFIDCQARELGAGGYQALAAPGSIVSIVLTSLLTLFVAGFGFRMPMGEAPALRDGVGAVAKIAFVLALATAWVPYRTLIYDVALTGPGELVAAIGAPAELPGTAGDLTERLDLVDQALVQLNDLGSGRQRGGQQDMRSRQVVGSNQVIVEPAQGNANPVEPFAFGLARIVFLVGAVGAFGAVRLVAGLLLALGPLFVAFALFDSTRGLFEGWVRGLAGAFLGAIAVWLLLASELALIEGWVADVLSQRLSNAPTPGAAIALLALTIIFGIVLVAGLAATTRVAAGFRLPAWQRATSRIERPAPVDRPLRSDLAGRDTAADPRSRAWAVADSVAAMQRREAASTNAGQRVPGPAGGPGRAAIVASANGGRTLASGAPVAAATQPLGRTNQRRTRARTSTSAGRRDARS